MNPFFLFALGLFAFPFPKTQAIQMSDLVPLENSVKVIRLSNGVKTYVQEHEGKRNCGSFRVVMKKNLAEEQIYRFDGEIDTLEEFFHFCKERASADQKMLTFDVLNFSGSDRPGLDHLLPQEMAVVAVGDFPENEMQGLIQKHFGDLVLSETQDASIGVGIDPSLSKVALCLSYLTPKKTIRTFEDLKDAWKVLLVQDLLQNRLERCSRLLEETWVHPHPRFIRPVNGYSLVTDEMPINLLSFFLWQVELIRAGGFFEDEFFFTKRDLLNQLQYRASMASLPDGSSLASYFADQFLLGDSCLSYGTFLSASAEMVGEIKSEDLLPHIDAFLDEKNRTIKVAYPAAYYEQAEQLTRDQIEEMIERVSSLASFYHDSEIPEDEISTLESKGRQEVPKLMRKNSDKASSLIQLASNVEPAKNHILQVNDDPTSPFYQLPIKEDDKRIVHYILSTMAEKNVIQLAMIKRSMEKKGKKIEYIHPMRFIGYILSTPELKSYLRKIKKSSFKWDAFVDGFAGRMKEEYGKNNLLVHVPGFCQQLGAHPDVVTKFIQKKDWEGLIKEYL